MAIGIAHWELDPNAWDRLILGTTVLPGVWDVTGSIARDITQKKGKGRDKAHFKDRGIQLGNFDLVGRFISPEAWAAMQLILPTIHPKKAGGLREPLFINHPKTQFLGISVIYIREIFTPQIDDGIVSIRMSAIEFAPPKKKKPSTNKPIAPAGVDTNTATPNSLILPTGVFDPL